MYVVDPAPLPTTDLAIAGRGLPASLGRLAASGRQAVSGRRIAQVAAVALWKLQSQLSTMALLGALAFASVWIALIVTLVWSAIATVAYFYGRRWGMPDLFAEQRTRSPSGHGRVLVTGLSVGQALLAGVQPFVYSRTLCRVLKQPATCRRTRAVRGFVLGLGLVLFGVTAAHHFLHRADYRGRRLLQWSLVGSCLNVTYRVTASAIVIGTLVHLSGAIPV